MDEMYCNECVGLGRIIFDKFYFLGERMRIYKYINNVLL